MNKMAVKRPYGYLMASFSGESEDGEQIRFSLSRDGFFWKDLNHGKPVLCSDIGCCGVRDPFLFRSADGNGFYIIATDLRIASGTGWNQAAEKGSLYITVWSSEDLVNWKGPWQCKAGPQGAGCVWAPKAVYLPEKEKYLVLWTSLVAGKYRIFRGCTSDFRSISDIRQYLEKPYDVIDLILIRSGDSYFRFYKDEEKKLICMDAGKEPEGTFREIKSETLEGLTGVEGPAAFFLPDGRCCLFADRFAEGKGYLPMLSGNLRTGVFRIPEEDEYDFGGTVKRHGCVLDLTEEEYDRIRNRWPLRL